MKQTRLEIAKENFLKALNELHYDPSNDNLNPEELHKKENEIVSIMVNELSSNEEETVEFFSEEGNFRYCYRLINLVQEKLNSKKLDEISKKMVELIKKGDGKSKMMNEELVDDINNFVSND